MKSRKRASIVHVIARNSEINILSLACFGGRTHICRIQRALKVNILHQYAYFLHVLISLNECMYGEKIKLKDDKRRLIIKGKDLGPVIFRFKKSEIPFRFRFIIGNVEFDEITIYRKKVR